MFHKASRGIFALLFTGSILSGCTRPAEPPSGPVVTSLKDVPAVRLNYRYEADVPAPNDVRRTGGDERNAAVQSDFDQKRPQELLDKTIVSPDGKRIMAVYHMPSDTQSEFRLDMYSNEGALLRKITPDAMAVHFPDTIVWSPDSSTVAFVAMTRGFSAIPTPNGTEPVKKTSPSGDSNSNSNANVGENVDPEANANSDLPPAPPTPIPPANVLTFRTEQIYICNADGDTIKPLTQNEGLIYFYYVWSPDSSMLAALAATGREWQYLEFQANEKKEQYVPIGRPRVIEKTGRERRLDDGLTAVQPVWSPDSAKIACGFGDQVRVYDSRGDVPTQAAIPLRNSLLISSQAYDREQQAKLDANADANVNANSALNVNKGNANAVPAPSLPPNALPDANTLVSFNPIISLNWPSEEQLYFQTAFVKRMRNEADSVMSFPRWHRLFLTPQPSVVGR
ncbi:MAG: hypothetical protein HOP17_06445 [Acidobacteria bacterium]|nr:hypothetical protein [Acidobacteriota bacterium]